MAPTAEQSLRDATRVDLAIALLKNKGYRNASGFFSLVSLALILWLGWNRWALIIPAGLALYAILHHLNVHIINEELKRRIPGA